MDDEGEKGLMDLNFKVGYEKLKIELDTPKVAINMFEGMQDLAWGLDVPALRIFWVWFVMPSAHSFLQKVVEVLKVRVGNLGEIGSCSACRDVSILGKISVGVLG